MSLQDIADKVGTLTDDDWRTDLDDHIGTFCLFFCLGMTMGGLLNGLHALYTRARAVIDT